MNWRRSAAAVSASVLAATMTMAIGAPAMAAERRDDAAESVTVPMELKGFDPKVAARNGFEIRTLANGRKYSVRVGTPAHFVPDPDDTAPASEGSGGGVVAFAAVSGDCGDSYVTVNNHTITTGYIVSYGVLYSKWGVTVKSDLMNSQNFNLDHGSSGPYWGWTGSPSPAHYGNGWARVNNGSYVLMTNGGMCYSGNPMHHFKFA